jgi:hypothetical protein
MSEKNILVELLLAGFFAVACMRARGAVSADQKMTFSSFFRLTDRIERLRRSRWQWFSMVLLVMALRLEQAQPLVLEIIVILEFFVFLALPTRADLHKEMHTR